MNSGLALHFPEKVQRQFCVLPPSLSVVIFFFFFWRSVFFPLKRSDSPDAVVHVHFAELKKEPWSSQDAVFFALEIDRWTRTVAPHPGRDDANNAVALLDRATF